MIEKFKQMCAQRTKKLVEQIYAQQDFDTQLATCVMWKGLFKDINFLELSAI